MVCAETYYVKNFDVYLGKIGEKSETNQSQRVVLQLTSCLKKGYNITVDNFFTSFPFAHNLLLRDITLIGTLRVNKKGIPKELLSHERELFSSEFRYTNDLTLVSYVPKKKTVVLVLSSGKPEKRVESTEKKKPLMILAYNETKAGVDTLDKLTKQYSVKIKSRRWTFALFTSLIDIGLVNAYVLFKEANSKDQQSRRKLHLQLAAQLCKSSSKTSQKEPEVTEMKGGYCKPRGKRCSKCPGRRPAKKTATEFCSNCKEAVCPDHFSITCVSCDASPNDSWWENIKIVRNEWKSIMSSYDDTPSFQRKKLRRPLTVKDGERKDGNLYSRSFSEIIWQKKTAFSSKDASLCAL